MGGGTLKIGELFEGQVKEVSNKEVLESTLEIEELMEEGRTFDEAVTYKIVLDTQRKHIEKHVEDEKHVFE